MDTRTKIVATLGPASDLARGARRVVARRRRRGAAQPQPRQLESHLATLQAVRASAERTGRVVAVLADLPGPKVRSGQFPDGGVELLGGQPVTMAPGDGPSTAHHITVDYPDPARPTCSAGDRVVLGDGAISLLVREVAEHLVHCTVLTGGRVQGRPGVHLPSERLAAVHPHRRRPRARPGDGRGRCRLPGGVVRAFGPRPAGDARSHRSRTTRGWSPRSRRCSAVADLDDIIAEADAVMVARGDLGIECPLEDVPHLQKRIVRACVEAGGAGHHRHADDGEHDHVAVAHACRGQRHRQRRVRRHRRADALGRDRDRRRPGGGGAHHGTASPGAPRWRRAIASGPPGSAECSALSWPEGPHRITLAITHAASLAAEDAGVDAIVCCTRSGRTALAMARFRPQAQLIGRLATTRRRCVPSRCRGACGRCSSITYNTTDDLVWHAVERVVQQRPASITARRCWCSPARPTVRVVRPPTCCVSCASRDGHPADTISSDEAGDPSQPLIAIVHGTMDRSAGMLRLSRRLDHRYRVLRYDRRGYGRSAPHDGPFGMDGQVDDLVGAARRPACRAGRATATAATSPWPRPPAIPSSSPVWRSTSRRMSWEPWWPGTTAGAVAVAAAAGHRRSRRRRSCVGSSATRRWEELPERTRADPPRRGCSAGGRARRPARAPPLARREDLRVPVFVGFGTAGRPHHQDGMARMAAMIAGATLVELDGCRHDAPTSHPAEFCHRAGRAAAGRGRGALGLSAACVGSVREPGRRPRCRRTCT